VNTKDFESLKKMLNKYGLKKRIEKPLICTLCGEELSIKEVKEHKCLNND